MQQNSSVSVPDWSTRQVVTATLFVVAVSLGFWLVYRFRLVLFILFIAIVLGTAIRPAVQWLNRRGMPRPAGVMVMYLLILLILVGFILLVIPLMTREAAQIAANVPDYYQDLRSAMIGSSSRPLRLLGSQLPVQLFYFLQQEQTDGETLDRVTQSFYIAGLMARSVFVVLAVFLLGFYWTLDSERVIRALLLLFHRKRRENTRELIAEVESRLGNFIRGQSMLVSAVGILSLVAYMIIGLPYALVLALFAGIMEAVPIIGPTLGAIPAVLVALSLDSSKIVWVVLATVVIQGLENYFLVPRVMGKSVGVSPFVILLSLAAFTSLIGLPGALLAIPMAAILQIILDRLVFSEPVEDKNVSGRDYFSMLRLEAQDLTRDIRMQLRQKETPTDDRTDQIEDQIELITRDLDELLERVAGQNG
jgi:predicted PurR-regulated permease PerM